MGKYRKILLILFFLSGACGLIYEVLWVRMLGLVFGNTTYAVSTVLAAFMAGLALGSWWFGKLSDKRQNHLVFYGKLQAGIGIYCALTPLLFYLIRKIYILIGTSGISPGSILLLFGTSFVVILIPTALMGGTLPVLSKYFVGQTEDIGSNVGILYSVNTWGAVLGAFATGYILIMLLGVKGTLYLAAAINLAIAGVVFLLAKGVAPLAVRQRETSVVTSKISPPSLLTTRYSLLVLIAIGLSGFTALTYEVVWTRVLSMVLGSSVYAFATMLCAFLAGIALGSMIYAKFSGSRTLQGAKETQAEACDYHTRSIVNFGFIEGGIGVSVLLLIPVFGILPFTFLKIFKAIGQNFVGFQFFQFLLAFGVMLVPTTLFGVTIPLACKIYSNSRQKALGTSVGNVYAANTIGAILGSILAGFVFIHLIGLQKTITIVAMINIGLAILLFNFGLKDKKWVRGLITCFVIFFTIPYVLSLPQWDKKIIASGIYQYAPDYLRESSLNPQKEGEIWKRRMEGKEMLFYKEGTHFTVAVQRHQSGVIGLSIDGKTDASNNFQGDMITQLLSAHLPLLLHPNPEDVLVIGLASGVTLGAVTRWEDVKEIDCVEIEPVMIEASHYFDEWNNKSLEDKRVKIIINDARNYLLTTKKKYDIIISEPSNPWITGCAPLFTKEHFELVKSRLKPDGIYCRWVQIYNMRPQDYKVIINTLSSAFPDLSIWNASGGDTLILAIPEKLSIDYQKLKEKFIIAKPDLEKIYLNEPIDLLAKFSMIPNFNKTKLNTDNFPLIEFSAARNLYNPKVSGRTYQMLLENTEPASSYLTNFTRYTSLVRTYLDKRLYIPAEKTLTAEYPTKDSAEYYNLLGFIYLKSKKYEQAIDILNKAITLDKKYVDAYVNLAEVYLRQKDYKKALELINKALKINSKYAPAYNLEGLIYMAQKNYDVALKKFEKAINIDSSFLAPYINRAIIYLDYMNVPPAAMFVLKDAVNVNPKSAEVYYHLGRVLFKLKDYHRAADMFSQAIFYNPDYEEIIRETLIKLQKKG
ncbi:Polyamine aminopropyltransferase [subsurface metagenome]